MHCVKTRWGLYTPYVLAWGMVYRIVHRIVPQNLPYGKNDNWIICAKKREKWYIKWCWNGTESDGFLHFSLVGYSPKFQYHPPLFDMDLHHWSKSSQWWCVIYCTLICMVENTCTIQLYTNTCQGSYVAWPELRVIYWMTQVEGHTLSESRMMCDPSQGS